MSIPLPLPTCADPTTRPTRTTRPGRQVRPETRTELGRPWNVIVWDDPINLMSYVEYVFQKLFGFSSQVAHTKMLEVHNEGRSLVATEDRERAEHHVSRLHAYGLLATMERVEDDAS